MLGLGALAAPSAVVETTLAASTISETTAFFIRRSPLDWDDCSIMHAVERSRHVADVKTA